MVRMMSEFVTVEATNAKTCKTIEPPSKSLVVKNRGSHDDTEGIELILEGSSVDTFLVLPSDGFLSLHASFDKLCFKKASNVSKAKVRLDIAILR